MADIFFPDPTSTLAKPRTGLLEAAGRGVLKAASEIADAVNAKAQTRADLESAADLIEDTDPNQAAAFREMSKNVSSYVPLAGGLDGARASQSASRSVVSSALSGVLDSFRETKKLNTQLEHTLIAQQDQFEKRKEMAEFSLNANTTLATLDNKFKTNRATEEDEKALDSFLLSNGNKFFKEGWQDLVGKRGPSRLSRIASMYKTQSDLDRDQQFEFERDALQGALRQEGMNIVQREHLRKTGEVLDDIGASSGGNGQVVFPRTQGDPVRDVEISTPVPTGLNDDDGPIYGRRTEKFQVPTQSTESQAASDALRARMSEVLQRIQAEKDKR